MNQDNYYAIEVKITSKNSWFTPAESNAYYSARYSREGITCHGWGGNETAAQHDNIVNYFLGQGNAGVKSTNYVCSDNKITLMVSPDNVAWCSQAGNPTTISIEFQPNMNAEGYKRGGWLIWQLEGRYGHRMNLYPHSKWAQTACPVGVDINRLRAEADKWATGGYLPQKPAPTPPVAVPVTPPAPTIKITYSKLPSPVMYSVNKNTDLWDFNTATWDGFVSKKKFIKGDLISIYGIADNHNVKAQYGMTAYSFGSADVNGSPKATTGINMKDLDLVTTPAQPIPTPPPTPPVVTPPVVVPPTTVDKNVVIAFLEGIIASIKEFITKLKG